MDASVTVSFYDNAYHYAPIPMTSRPPTISGFPAS